MQLQKLILFASAPLNDIYKRSYKTTITPEAVTALDNATLGGKSVTQQAISQVATSIIAPSAETEGVAEIAHGWSQPRFRFMMEVLETAIGGTTNIAYYIGHTDYMDGATTPLSGNRLGIDPNLKFHVNAVHRLRNQILSVNGQQMTRQVGDNFSQVLYGKNTLSNLFTSPNAGMDAFKIRPIDVYRSRDVINNLNSAGLMAGENIVNTSGSMLMGAELSSRRNNTPGLYLYDALRAHSQAVGTREATGGDDITMVNEAISMMTDYGSEAYQDPFFHLMRDIEQSIQHRGEFTWKNILTLWNYADDVTHVVNASDVAKMRGGLNTDNNYYTNVWGAHNTSSWASSDIETVAATLLANAIPTIMLENLTASMRFTMTNMTETGDIAHQIDGYHPLSEHVDGVAMINRIIDRIKLELMPLVTQQNNFAVRLMVDSSVYGDTAIHIAITSPEFRTFVMPTFADNAASPVLTNSMDRFNQVTNDIYNLGYQLFEQRPGYLQPKQPQIITTPFMNGGQIY